MKPKAQARFDRLYDEHLRALKRHGKADKTIEAYGRAVRRLSDFINDCPDALSVDVLNAYFEWLIDNRGWSTVKLDRNVSGRSSSLSDFAGGHGTIAAS